MLSGFCGSHIAERGGIHAQVTSFVHHLDREVARSSRKAVLRRRYVEPEELFGRMRLRINEDARVEHALRI